jgi:hypothetical protein
MARYISLDLCSPQYREIQLCQHRCHQGFPWGLDQYAPLTSCLALAAQQPLNSGRGREVKEVLKLVLRRLSFERNQCYAAIVCVSLAPLLFLTCHLHAKWLPR